MTLTEALDLSWERLEALASARVRLAAQQTLVLAQGLAAAWDQDAWTDWQQRMIALANTTTE